MYQVSHLRSRPGHIGVPQLGPPRIRWEKDGSLFLLGEGRRIINSTLVNGTGQSQLEIESLLISDAGLYNCTISNTAGTTSRTVRLEVGGE